MLQKIYATEEVDGSVSRSEWKGTATVYYKYNHRKYET